MFLDCRHHTNPVGTEWRWKMDNPENILKECLENHYQMIKQFRGTVCHDDQLCVCARACVYVCT